MGTTGDTAIDYKTIAFSNMPVSKRKMGLAK
jgi:hypothetical protein